MASTDADLIAFIRNLSTQINRYFSIFVFLFGTVGNLLNILVLSRRTFRTNSCAVLFLVSSIANLIAILSGLTSRTLSGWAADLTNTNRFLCKFRAFVLNAARAVAFWLILLAMIDRWLLSSKNARLRRISTMKTAQQGIAIIIIASIVIFSQILYCYEPNLINSPLKCYGLTLACRFVTDLSFTFLIIVIPLLLMLIFGLMTINNIRHSRDKVRPTNMSVVNNGLSVNANVSLGRSRTDFRLLAMLLTQILLLFIFGLPLGIQKLYATFTASRNPSNWQAAIEDFVYNFALLLNFVTNGIPFYIYTLVGGNLFRAELWKIFSIMKRCVLCLQ